MSRGFYRILDGDGLYLVQRERGIPGQPFVLRRYLPGIVLKFPGRIGNDGGKLPLPYEPAEIFGCAECFHPC